LFDKALIKEIIQQVLHSIELIERRFSGIKSADDFLESDEGLDMLDAICMQLIAIGESIKNIDKISQKALFARYPEIDWRGVMGMRDIISHHYFDMDAELIYQVCSDELKPLAKTLRKIQLDME
jgi:uncharacterized protein with HEPN domain